jgi:hypothetical protein
MNQSQLQFWQFCDIAKCLPASVNNNLATIHKNLYKHPQFHELRAQWVVERAKRLAHQDLNIDLVIAASQREEANLHSADKHKLTIIQF